MRDSSRLTQVGAHDVGAVEDFPVGELRPAGIPGKDVWVLRKPDGSFYAVKNSCPHQAAPLCLGDVSGTFLPSEPGVYELGLEYEVIRCPYHGYEYSLETGRSLYADVRERVVRYDVTVEGGRVLVSDKGK